MIIATDLEGVLVPEIWERIAAETGIAELARTTRDEPDFEKLMEQRVAILSRHDLRVGDLERIARSVDPYPGSIDLLSWFRSIAQVFIVSDTFHELSEGLVRRMGGFTLFANRFRVDSGGRIVGVHLRIRGRKDQVIRSVQEIGFRVIAVGDSYNDERVLRSADHAVLYRGPADLAARLAGVRVAEDFADLRRHVQEIVRAEEAAGLDDAASRDAARLAG